MSTTPRTRCKIPRRVTKSKPYVKQREKHLGKENEGHMNEEEACESVMMDPPLVSRFENDHFNKACQILRALTFPNLKLERPHFDNDKERILTYELCVNILQYSSFLDEALASAKFYGTEIKNYYWKEEVLVLMFDLLERDFRLHPDDPPIERRFYYLRMELLEYRTKILAHMARLRIRHEATMLDMLLPENLRHQHHIDKNPLYGWINLKKIRMPDTEYSLRKMGFTRSEIEDDLLIQERSYFIDASHSDLIRFHSSRLEFLNDCDLVKDGKLIIQDKSACLYVYCMLRALFYKESAERDGTLPLKSTSKYQFADGDSSSIISNYECEEWPVICNSWFDGIFDAIGKPQVGPDCIIVTHAGSCRSVAHLACLLAEVAPRYVATTSFMKSEVDLLTSIKNKFVARPILNVIAFGLPYHKHEEYLNFFRNQVTLFNVKLYADDFLEIPKRDKRVKGACAILVNAPSTGSALKDPVSYICSEGGDEDVLVELSRFVKSRINFKTNSTSAGTLDFTSKQNSYLKHALGFNHVKLVLYTTCSLLPAENDEVVENVLNDMKRTEEATRRKVLGDIVQRHPIKKFKETSYELVDLNVVMDRYERYCFRGPFFEMPPSSACSGVFMALIRRRERSVSVGRNPIKAFVESQLNSPMRLDSLLSFGLSPTDAREHFVKFLDGDLQEKQFIEYVTKAYNLSASRPVSRKSASQSQTISIRPPSRKQSAGKEAGDRPLSQRAIVQRVSVPTYSSLAKKTDKWSSPSEINKDCPIHGPQIHGKSFVQGMNECVCDRHSRLFPGYVTP